MGRNVSTVSRELKRNRTHKYDIHAYYPYTAQKKYKLRRFYCHRGMFQDLEKLEYIKEKLFRHSHRSRLPIRLANWICFLCVQFAAGYTRNMSM